MAGVIITHITQGGSDEPLVLITPGPIHHVWVWQHEQHEEREEGGGREKECSIGICQLKLSLIVAEINIYNSDSPQNTAEGDLTADIYPHLHNWQL